MRCSARQARTGHLLTCFSMTTSDNTEKKKYPYPVLAVTDLANNYSPAHFRFAIGHCRDVIAKVSAEDNTSDQQMARVRILKYLDLQLARAVRWIEDEADLMAGVMRSLIELKVLGEFHLRKSRKGGAVPTRSVN